MILMPGYGESRRAMVLFTLRLQAPPEKRHEIVQTLRSVVGPTQAERGSAGCHIDQDLDDPNVLTLVEAWRQQADLDRHLASEDYRKLLAIMDMASAPPSVQLLAVLDEYGLDRIAQARAGNRND
jgi:quinol monooxygenase YgiN